MTEGRLMLQRLRENLGGEGEQMTLLQDVKYHPSVYLSWHSKVGV
jgi:hypothetical protein